MTEFLNPLQAEINWEIAKKEVDLEKPQIAAEVLETEIPLSSETKADKLPVFSMPAIDKDYIEADVMADDILFTSGDQNLINNWADFRKTATVEQLESILGADIAKIESEKRSQYSLLVVDDNDAVKMAFSRALGEKMPNAILVNVNYLPENKGQRSANHGIDAAIELIKNDRPLILYSFLTREWFNFDQKFHYLLGHKNCAFIEMPARLEEIKNIYQKLLKVIDNPDVCDDELSKSLLNIEIDFGKTISALQHDLKNAESLGAEDKLKLCLLRARQAGYSGEDREIIEAVQKAEKPDYAPFQNRQFDGLFVDIEGTLLQNGQLNESLIAELKEKEKNGESITVWTGGDAKKYAQLLRQHKLPWKVLPKQIFRGATVKAAIDDLTAEQLKRQYGFEVKEFKNINI